jgi:catechol O-methyltransferase
MTPPDPDDAFDCFGAGEDDSENNDEEQATTSNNNFAAAIRRDSACGLFSFHSGTEQSLLNFVQRELEATNNKITNHENENDNVSRARTILKLVDQFCYSRHWMMHVGDQKGPILADFCREFCQSPKIRDIITSTESASSNDKKNDASATVVNMVELGTYCGYSAILMAVSMLETICSASSAEQQKKMAKFHIYSVDVDPKHQAVAAKLVHMAQLDEYVTFILLPITQPSTLVEALQRTMTADGLYPNNKAIDFLFIDHDKDMYLPDLKLLEQSGMIQKGSHVAADNVVFFQIRNYRDYIEILKETNIVTSRLVKSELEYIIPEEIDGGASCNRQQASEPASWQDGMELTVYFVEPTQRKLNE